MARTMKMGQVDLWRSVNVEKSWSGVEHTYVYGPYTTIAAAKRAVDRDYILVSKKIQKLTAVNEYSEGFQGLSFPTGKLLLEWMDV